LAQVLAGVFSIHYEFVPCPRPRVKRTSMPMPTYFDGCTGSCTGLAQEPTVMARLTYLSFNLAFILLNLLGGYYVYESTKSLTIEVDFMSFGCEVLAVLINIIIEMVKRRQMQPKSVLILDLIGGMSSLALLIAVGMFGVFAAISTEEQLEENRGPPPAQHLTQMLKFSTFSLTLSVVNLSIFGSLKDRMLPADGEVHDQLNLMSNLAHSLVDFVTNFAVLGTSFWLKYGVKEDNWMEMRKHKVWVDVFGSFMVCACILVSILWLMRDVFHCVSWIRELEAEEAGLSTGKLEDGGDAKLKVGQAPNYGAMAA